MPAPMRMSPTLADLAHNGSSSEFRRNEVESWARGLSSPMQIPRQSRSHSQEIAKPTLDARAVALPEKEALTSKHEDKTEEEKKAMKKWQKQIHSQTTFRPISKVGRRTSIAMISVIDPGQGKTPRLKSSRPSAKASRRRPRKEVKTKKSRSFLPKFTVTQLANLVKDSGITELKADREKEWKTETRMKPKGIFPNRKRSQRMKRRYNNKKQDCRTRNLRLMNMWDGMLVGMLSAGLRKDLMLDPSEDQLGKNDLSVLKSLDDWLKASGLEENHSIVGISADGKEMIKMSEEALPPFTAKEWGSHNWQISWLTGLVRCVRMLNLVYVLESGNYWKKHDGTIRPFCGLCKKRHYSWAREYRSEKGSNECVLQDLSGGRGFYTNRACIRTAVDFHKLMRVLHNNEKDPYNLLAKYIWKIDAPTPLAWERTVIRHFQQVWGCRVVTVRNRAHMVDIMQRYAKQRSINFLFTQDYDIEFWKTNSAPKLVRKSAGKWM
uniref:Uncharacterized protein n=2 Tax=Lotharella globosa TaxID=91324 RepID=A0A7S3ZBI4_9EUKA|mmetsp:Transcript_14486/g.29228  ORF Transcript_14486/g.29228 Transcript_14486/m.29228 type:complete len:493 (+) Transcript_14486:114-1592(+)